MSGPLGILDIGSNSVRFALLERDDGGAFFVPGGKNRITARPARDILSSKETSC